MIRLLTTLSIFIFIFGCKDKNLSQNNVKTNQSITQEPIKNKNPKYDLGSTTFKNNCSSCHRMDKKLIGPPLEMITKKREKKWLLSFIKNNRKLIDQKDSTALKVWYKYNKAIMPQFEHLENDEMEALYYYLDIYKK